MQENPKLNIESIYGIKRRMGSMQIIEYIGYLILNVMAAILGTGIVPPWDIV